MQYVYGINSSFTVTSLLDLPLLRDILEVCNLKPNYSLLGRELGYDRRTIKSHYENGTPDSHRHKPSTIDAFYDIIQTLLSDDPPTILLQVCSMAILGRQPWTHSCLLYISRLYFKDTSISILF